MTIAPAITLCISGCAANGAPFCRVCELQISISESAGRSAVAMAGAEVVPQPPVPAVALHSNSGDGLGVHKPGSHTWGGDLLATAPSGRADDSAKCPAVTGSLLVAAEVGRGAPAPVGVSSLDLAEPATVGSALSFEEEVSACERDAIFLRPSLAPVSDKNASASLTRAVICSSAALSTDISTLTIRA
jgi:hypothetical protein